MPPEVAEILMAPLALQVTFVTTFAVGMLMTVGCVTIAVPEQQIVPLKDTS